MSHLHNPGREIFSGETEECPFGKVRVTFVKQRRASAFRFILPNHSLYSPFSTMWFIVNTDKFQEQNAKDFLGSTYPGIVKQVYLPKCRTKCVDAKGEERVRFRPLIYGMLFIKADSVNALRRIVTNWGYFAYQDDVRDLATGKMHKDTLVSNAHLLCRDVKELDQTAIIRNATIPDEDMERFIYYSDKIADGIEGLSIVDKRYSDLILENDTIRIINGPLKGWVGVVKQIKSKGKKDRHLLVRFGNNRCLNISNIRQYSMQIEHEATMGAKAEAVGAWRAIDQMIGFLQTKEPTEDAPATLRRLFADYLKMQADDRKCRMSGTARNGKAKRNAAWEDEILGRMDGAMRNNFRILANYFHADNAALGQTLRDLIPDAVLRPFLTPTAGVSVPDGQHYAAFAHNGIVELVIRCNLGDFFRGKEYDKDKYSPVFDEDYEYYAHVALLKNENDKVKAVTSWGGFYDYYASQSVAERSKFVADLEAKHYLHLHYLLAESKFNFEKVGGIGGFSVDLDIGYSDDINLMAAQSVELLHQQDGEPSFMAQTTASAVEMWQGARLLVWRQLLQRYVLLHKVPVVDQPSVISSDIELEKAFAKTGGELNIDEIGKLLSARKQTIESRLACNNLSGAVLVFLSTSLVFSSHFAKDDLYNYISATFHPDTTLTSLFTLLVSALRTAPSSASVVSRLYKGMAELQEQDSWKYFKFPSFLKQIGKVERMGKGV